MKPMFRHPLRFMRDHRFTVAHASEFLDGELSQAQAVRVREHSSLCPHCHELLRTLKETVAGLSRLRDGDSSDSQVTGSVLARLRDEP